MLEYTIDEVLDFIIAEFDLDDLLLIEPDRRNSLKQYIQNNLSKKNIPFVRQEVDKKGKPKIYNQQSINLLIKYCGKYFISLSAKTDDEKKELIQRYKEMQQLADNYYDDREPLSVDHFLKILNAPPLSDEEAHAQHLASELQSDFLENYEKRKYQVMLEAIFSRYFVLNESNLKEDVRNDSYHRVYDDFNSNIARSLSRLEDVTNYYKDKTNDE